jgi:hypothetical protein
LPAGEVAQGFGLFNTIPFAVLPTQNQQLYEHYCSFFCLEALQNENNLGFTLSG